MLKLGDKKSWIEQKEETLGGNYWGGIQQKYYMNRMIDSLKKNI